MRKPRNNASGFSAAKPATTPTPKTRQQANHSAQEQQAIALIQQGKMQEAEAIYRCLIADGAASPIAYSNLAAICGMTERQEESIILLNKALKLEPNYPEAHNNLGLALQEQGNLDAAIASYHKALKLNPSNPDAHYNLGNALTAQGNLDAAMASYHKALELKPAFPDAHWNLSHTQLLKGDYQEGRESYQWRFKKAEDPTQPHADPKTNQWDGRRLQTGTKLLLVSEQALGDTLQFMRYALQLRHQGVDVSLCAPAKLHGLIQASGIHPKPLTPEQANAVSAGQWIPLLSLPRHLGVCPDNPIITEPYIATTDDSIAKWRNVLSTEQRPIIGINWQGDPSHEKKQFQRTFSSLGDLRTDCSTNERHPSIAPEGLWL